MGLASAPRPALHGGGLVMYASGWRLVGKPIKKEKTAIQLVGNASRHVVDGVHGYLFSDSRGRAMRRADA